ncbi:hypothetical protein EJB05_15439 [Eragrostis curvula]|uniref:Uncharacterized protein n=1 Tax=Eragrostis curvula TaxID=38414 RepID=A0A5J9VZK1_9POAL|nr:hypothetical protein EJB05_15439 [Eragrostis curvula]
MARIDAIPSRRLVLQVPQGPEAPGLESMVHAVLALAWWEEDCTTRTGQNACANGLIWAEMAQKIWPKNS